MPNIRLKHGSPEFADEFKIPGSGDRAKADVKYCHVPGCPEMGVHKAPKDRSLSEYYWFCPEHIVEYNKSWDFFAGMSQAEIEEHIERSAKWDRPTSKSTANFAEMEEALRKRAWQTRGRTDWGNGKSGSDDANANEKDYKGSTALESGSPEFHAMAVMGLEPPLNLEIIKRRYKELAKKHHPDRNHGCRKAEDILKNINSAYTVLKAAYERFEKLPKSQK